MAHGHQVRGGGRVVLRDGGAEAARHEVGARGVEALVRGHKPAEHEARAAQHFALHVRNDALQVRYLLVLVLFVEVVKVSGRCKIRVNHSAISARTSDVRCIDCVLKTKDGATCTLRLRQGKMVTLISKHLLCYSMPKNLLKTDTFLPVDFKVNYLMTFV